MYSMKGDYYSIFDICMYIGSSPTEKQDRRTEAVLDAAFGDQPHQAQPGTVGTQLIVLKMGADLLTAEA